ncbi:ABC transporter ATP-binding protein [Haloechinothrix halophila]|uniref:ABC transporter ATP-binding protein n=1 Tax=Haloechinothrix halophila TaxID=1069073 RepID=UPI001E35027D|nr:ABC transporter ATP-binding protein [Haloechinothrix halophila]
MNPLTRSAPAEAPPVQDTDTHLTVSRLACAAGKRVVLRDVDFAVQRGELLALVGANGSGKSTLLRALGGVRKPVAGEVLLDDLPLGQLSARRRARAITLVGQEEALPADLVVGEMVALGRTPHRPPWAGGDATERAAVLAALDQVGLGYAVDHPVEQLSGGERRRALLARGLAQQTPLMLLDEPTNHLDLRHQLGLLRTVRGLGKTVVVAMHDLDLAATFCDRIAVLHDGTLLTIGTPADALTPTVIHDAFGVLATPVTHPLTGRTHLLFSPDETEPHP